MQGLEIRTKLFPPEHEGDKEYGNGKPGSQLAAWIRNKLDERGYQCADIIQEDYGWGFYISDQNLDIWVTVGLMDEQVNNTPQWGIFAEHNAPFKPVQWIKKREGKIAAANILSALKAVIASESNIAIAAEYQDHSV
jgi:hypothetical protein